MLDIFNTMATNIYRNELIRLLPSLPTDLKKYHITNLQLGVCTCTGFIVKGQPYFCKHLYALLYLQTKEEYNVN
jgi:hypothetical protein